MNLHEYQAKELLKKFGVPVLPGFLAYTPQEARKAAVDLNVDQEKDEIVVVKAQVHAGGRGKAGGVKIARSSQEARDVASMILGMRLITPQTGESGKLVSKVWVEHGAKINREFYVSFVVDRANARTALIASSQGGMEIEEVARREPDKVLTVGIPTETGLQGFHCRKVAFELGIEKEKQSAFFLLLDRLYTAFSAYDCSLLEINPLIQTVDESGKPGEFICLDCKMVIDDNALYRQPVVRRFVDYDEIDEREIQADRLGISYIALSGNIGCMVNGAGLAMATMDIIKKEGGSPANFLDVGGGATKEKVEEAFKIILKDSSVKGILVNIFGGIMRCDVIAEGVIAAANSLAIGVPLVVRLEGTNVELGKELLRNSGLRIIAADGMLDAAKKIVAAVNDDQKLGGK